MTEEAVIKIVLDEAFHVHKKVGPGMLESVIKPVWHIGYKSEDSFGNGKARACIF